jgi:hypothetical protein
MEKVLFISDVVSMSEQVIEDDNKASVILHIEVETATGRQVLSLSPEVARQLLQGLDHILKGD